MRRLIATAAAAVAVASALGGPATAHATTECTPSAHEPVTTGHEHIATGQMTCASDEGATVSLTVCLQMFRELGWTSIECGGGPMSVNLAANLVVNAAAVCNSMPQWPYHNAMPRGTGLFRTWVRGDWPGALPAQRGPFTSAPVPLACAGR